MDKRSWILKNCRFAQQQSFDFYNPAEYSSAKPLNETQDQQFWKWVNAENNPTRLDPLESLEAVIDYHPEYIQSFIRAFQNIYQPEDVEFETGARVLKATINGRIYVIESGSIEDGIEWIQRKYDHQLLEYVNERDFSKEFWEGVANGYVLYHATNKDYLDSIMEQGLNQEDRTRGISNRGMGAAVFTGPEPSALDSYGDAILEIDVSTMKATGYMPNVSQEEPFSEENMKSAIAYKLGLSDDWIGGEYGSEGLTEDTIVFYGPIPAQYLSIYYDPRTSV